MCTLIKFWSKVYKKDKKKKKTFCVFENMKITLFSWVHLKLLSMVSMTWVMRKVRVKKNKKKKIKENSQW